MAVTVIGAGNWGTTLALLFSETNNVHLCTRSPVHAEEINRNRENLRYLPGVSLPPSLVAVPLSEAVFSADDVVVVAVPSRVLSELTNSSYQGL
jgi:glycerol-3-phosphate dehydrogenase (NAD(P)+)